MVFLSQKAGYPDFSSVAFWGKDGRVFKAELGKLAGESKKDINQAETIYQKFYPWQDGYTWHHVENSTYLIRVPTVVHQLIDHAGGRSTAVLDQVSKQGVEKMTRAAT